MFLWEAGADMKCTVFVLVPQDGEFLVTDPCKELQDLKELEQ